MGICIVVFLYCVMALFAFAIIVVMPREIWRSLRTGVIYVNDRPVRRSTCPIFYWLAVIAASVYVGWAALRIIYDWALKPILALHLRR